MKVLKMAGWITVALVALGVIVNYPDLQRYMKIESM